MPKFTCKLLKMSRRAAPIEKKGRGTQPGRSQRSTAQESSDGSESAEEEDVQPKTSKQKRSRTENGDDIPATVIGWAERGFYDLPAIPNFDEDKDEENDSEDTSLLVKIILLMHHKKESFTERRKRRCLACIECSLHT